jgi:tRNA modification GTPase
MAVAETIFARASADGIAGVAVLRISGPGAFTAVSALTGGRLPAPRQAVLRMLRDPADGTQVDQALVLLFPAPHSFTGEDVAELHCHGSRAVIAELYRLLAGMDGLRPAEAGEFTRRAFDNDRMDLTQVEGLADLLQAETTSQQRQALRQMEGALGRLYDGWRDRLVRALAHVEAEIDFPDEDLPGDVLAPVRQSIAGLKREISGHLADGNRGERLRDGYRIAIAGRPNVGKSSLLNALARRDVAIVSDIAGTTRDVIEVHLDIGGYPVILADTAGLRETDDPVEREGVVRSTRRMAEADLVLLVSEVGDPDPVSDDVPADRLMLVNKIDREPGKDLPDGAIGISARTGEGLDRLIGEIRDRLDISPLAASGEAPLTRARHRQALERALLSLDRFESAGLPELAAEDLRLAVREIGRITGLVDVEDLLDVIFRDFCIGK